MHTPKWKVEQRRDVHKWWHTVRIVSEWFSPRAFRQTRLLSSSLTAVESRDTSTRSCSDDRMYCRYPRERQHYLSRCLNNPSSIWTIRLASRHSRGRRKTILLVNNGPFFARIFFARQFRTLTKIITVFLAVINFFKNNSDTPRHRLPHVGINSHVDINSLKFRGFNQKY